jgi:hypothetical protein
VLVHYVFKGDVDAAEHNEGLQYRKENVENKRHLVQTFLNNNEVDLRVEFISNKRPPVRPPLVESHSLTFSDAVRIDAADGHKTMHVGFVPLMDLYRVYKSLGRQFLSRNIRFGLSSESPPNSKMREAFTEIVIKGKVPPDVFAFNHNGVSLAAERLAFENGRAVIEVPRLLNGAQAITSVDRFLRENEGHPSLKANAGALEAIRVLSRIVVDDPFSDFVTNVTICNNRQNIRGEPVLADARLGYRDRSKPLVLHGRFSTGALEGIAARFRKIPGEHRC